jgi:hypothetical protein
VVHRATALPLRLERPDTAHRSEQYAYRRITAFLLEEQTPHPEILTKTSLDFKPSNQKACQVAPYQNNSFNANWNCRLVVLVPTILPTPPE